MIVVASAARRAKILVRRHAAKIMIADIGLQDDGCRDFSAADQLGQNLIDTAVQFFREMFRTQEIGDPVEGIIIDEDRAEQRLFDLDVMRRRAKVLFRRCSCAAVT